LDNLHETGRKKQPGALEGKMRPYKKILMPPDLFLPAILLFSIPLHAAVVMLGSFEGSMDGWTADGSVSVSYSTQGVTAGASSLQVVFPSGWLGILKKNMLPQPDLLKTMTAIQLDVTTRNDAGQIPGGWLNLFFVINSQTGGWQQFNLSYPGVPSSPRTDTLTVTIPQSVRDTFIQNGAGGWAEFFIITNSGTGGGTLWLDNIRAVLPDSGTVTIQISADAPIRTIPMTLYGANLQSWDGAQAGTNTTFNNLMKASGRKYFRIPGGSWSNGHLWSDIEGPNGTAAWKVSYTEYLNLMAALSQPGETTPPTLQPIVNFPGWWYDTLQDDTPYDEENQNYQIAHQKAVNAAVAWVQDQTSRPVCAQYWEIGNEIGGPWEVGWFEGISGTYYGDRFADFYLAMKAVNPSIKIGACAEPKHELQPWGWYVGYWTYDTLVAAAAKNAVPDFLIIHAYPGSGQPASYNPTLLSTDIDDIGVFTSSLNSIVQNALGAQYVGQIRYGMTEWDAGGHDSYNRVSCYVNALFHAQYILEMARHNWDLSNPWIPEYRADFRVYPVWYVNPMLIHHFGRHMVQASSSNTPLVRAYAAKDDQGNLTIFVFNNSPSSDITANIQITGFSAGQSGQQWLLEPDGAVISGGITVQDKDDIRINGVLHPDPLAAPSYAPQAFRSGNTFQIPLPASGMMLMKIPPPNSDTTPPAAPTGLTAVLNGINIRLDWNDNTEPDLRGYHIYRSTTFGSGYRRLNAAVLTESGYLDTAVASGQTYYYVVRAVDTLWNESDVSSQASATVPKTALGTILYERWDGIPGSSVSSLTSNPAYPNNPSFAGRLTALEGPSNIGENYGTRIRGYLYPPATGPYTFWIAGDDNCQLRLSTDGNPANASLIASVPGWTDPRQWNKYSSQQSSPRTLTAGQKYYIEVLHKEYTGGDHVAVAWSGPGFSQEVIAGNYLSPWLSGLYGDFNSSGAVSIEDLMHLAEVWVSNNCVLTSAVDQNGDCVVDLSEFAEFARNWLK